MRTLIVYLITFITIFASVELLANKNEPKAQRTGQVYAPRYTSGILRYTGGIFAPIHFWEPYKYALYNTDGRFLAYIDDSKIVGTRIETMLDSYVVVKGPTSSIGKDILILAEQITFKKN